MHYALGLSCKVMFCPPDTQVVLVMYSGGKLLLPLPQSHHSFYLPHLLRAVQGPGTYLRDSHNVLTSQGGVSHPDRPCAQSHNMTK